MHKCGSKPGCKIHEYTRTRSCAHVRWWPTDMCANKEIGLCCEHVPKVLGVWKQAAVRMTLPAVLCCVVLCCDVLCCAVLLELNLPGRPDHTPAPTTHVGTQRCEFH